MLKESYTSSLNIKDEYLTDIAVFEMEEYKMSYTTCSCQETIGWLCHMQLQGNHWLVMSHAAARKLLVGYVTCSCKETIGWLCHMQLQGNYWLVMSHAAARKQLVGYVTRSCKETIGWLCHMQLQGNY